MTLGYRHIASALSLVIASFHAPIACAGEPPKTEVSDSADRSPPTVKPAPDRLFAPQAVRSSGSVTVGGKPIAYDTVAGTLVVHAAGWDDTAWREEAAKAKSDDKDDDKDDAEPPAEASMFYVAYFKKGVAAEDRPITFLYNGGPGSPTIWLHMGAFGPRKVVTTNGGYTPAAPYALVNNADSLLDASDLVFIDAPGTGYSRIAGKDKDKAFYGVDQDGHAFASFIKAFLTRYDRWNSPRYLFGESYGTPRSVVIAHQLQSNDSLQFNGIMLLSQILNFALSGDDPGYNPAIDTPYVVMLPTMAATAWYHNRLPGTRPPELEPFLREVEHFATTDYAAALAQGSELDLAAKQTTAAKLAAYTGISADYLMRANLRLDVATFQQQLLNSEGDVVGRLDSRFRAPADDVLAKKSNFDPLDQAIGSAFVSAFHDYSSRTLGWKPDEPFKASIDPKWDLRHQPPGATEVQYIAPNVMPDLAETMKQNPELKVLLLGGYFDLATPFFEGMYEMHHLPIPDRLQANIAYRYFPSGHMVYANPDAARALHDAAADFIRRTSHPAG